MTSVLIIHERADVAGALRDALGSVGSAACCRTLDEALDQLAHSAPDLVVCDVSTRGARYPSVVRRAAPRAAVLGVLDETTEEADPRAVADLSEGIVLRPPFVPARLAEAARIAEQSRRRFVGNLSGVSLVDVMQMFHLGRRTATLVLDGATVGRIDFDRGDLVHAECDGQQGRDALARLVNAPRGRFRSVAYTPGPRTIRAQFDVLLMEALRANDPLDGPESFDGLDSIRSWAPPPCEQAVASVPLIPPVSVPVHVEETEAPIATRWRSAQAELPAHGRPHWIACVRGPSRSLQMLEGTAPSDLADTVLPLVAELSRVMGPVRTGLMEYQTKGLSLAMMWDAIEGDVLLLARDAREGAGAFRAYVAAAGARVAAAAAAVAEAPAR